MTLAPAWRPAPDASHTQVPERFPGEAWVGQVEWIAADAAEEGQLDEAFAGGVDGVVGCLGAAAVIIIVRVAVAVVAAAAAAVVVVVVVLVRRGRRRGLPRFAA